MSLEYTQITRGSYEYRKYKAARTGSIEDEHEG